jgi:hypothetical protein
MCFQFIFERKINMSIHYEVISEDNIICIKDLCNDLMAYQKSKAYIHPELFDGMCFETRMIPSVKSAKVNYILVAKDDNEIVGYVYSKFHQRRHIRMNLLLFLTLLL